MSASERPSALQISIELWHPGCWVIETTERFDVGFLGYGIYTTGDSATTLFTVYADTQAEIDEALEVVAEYSAVYSASELSPDYRHATVPSPGNATRELLVNHDGSKQVSNALTSREFVCSQPIDIRDGKEYWTLLSNHDRDGVGQRLDEVRQEKDAEIRVRSMTRASWRSVGRSLPLDRLSSRQLEVFRLARERGYYEWPKETSASELADELGISTSTFHEHLHKAEAKLLGRDEHSL